MSFKSTIPAAFVYTISIPDFTADHNTINSAFYPAFYTTLELSYQESIDTTIYFSNFRAFVATDLQSDFETFSHAFFTTIPLSF